jgi:hypothetical protein
MTDTRAWYFTGLVFFYLATLAGVYLITGNPRYAALVMTIEFGVTGLAVLLGGDQS